MNSSCSLRPTFKSMSMVLWITHLWGGRTKPAKCGQPKLDNVDDRILAMWTTKVCRCGQPKPGNVETRPLWRKARASEIWRTGHCGGEVSSARTTISQA